MESESVLYCNPEMKSFFREAADTLSPPAFSLFFRLCVIGDTMDECRDIGGFSKSLHELSEKRYIFPMEYDGDDEVLSYFIPIHGKKIFLQ